jgi:hypothetical protein
MGQGRGKSSAPGGSRSTGVPTERSQLRLAAAHTNWSTSSRPGDVPWEDIRSTVPACSAGGVV